MVAKKLGAVHGRDIVVLMIYDYETTLSKGVQELPALLVAGESVWSGGLPQTELFAAWLDGFLRENQ